MDLPLQAQRMKLLQVADSEKAYVVSEMRIKKALLSRTPAAARVIHAPGDLVRVYHEGDKRFLGPFRVVKVDEKEVYVDYDGRLAHFNAVEVIQEKTGCGDGIMQFVCDQLRLLVSTTEVSSSYHRKRTLPLSPSA